MPRSVRSPGAKSTAQAVPGRSTARHRVKVTGHCGVDPLSHLGDEWAAMQLGSFVGRPVAAHPRSFLRELELLKAWQGVSTHSAGSVDHRTHTRQLLHSNKTAEYYTRQYSTSQRAGGALTIRRVVDILPADKEDGHREPFHPQRD